MKIEILGSLVQLVKIKDSVSRKKRHKVGCLYYYK